MMLFFAGDNPATAANLVQARIAAETEQTEKLYGYTFRLGSQEITPNDIDRRLRESTDLAERQAAWEASKAIGPTPSPASSSSATSATA